VDSTFKNTWIKTSFSSQDNTDNNSYKKQNLNMPDALPKRSSSPNSFLYDTPLTQIGEFQAILTGKGLSEQNVLREGFLVYVSPALRSIQTAAGLSKGMDLDDFKMKIEPDLFEFTHLHSKHPPTFMSIQELEENGFKVDPSYVPVNSLKKDETLEDFYERSYNLIQHLLIESSEDLLLVAHEPSLETLTRQLLGGRIRTLEEIRKVIRLIPYCGTAIIEQDYQSKNWKLISIPQMELKHGSVQDFEAKKVL
jgi:ubiquitin-associated SH3 domain-containing protein